MVRTLHMSCNPCSTKDTGGGGYVPLDPLHKKLRTARPVLRMQGKQLVRTLRMSDELDDVFTFPSPLRHLACSGL